MRIVIPTNDERCWRKCVSAIQENEPWVKWGDIRAVIAEWLIEDCPSDWTIGIEPFCFSRNVNIAIPPNGSGVIILNHDALLETPGGFSSMVAYADQHPEYGVVSSAIRGACCNPAQQYVGLPPRMEDTDITVAFVCVYIPRRTLDLVGLLDERLTGYGYDDDLYCTQVRATGLKVGIWHGCVVEHGSLPSSYRSRADCGEKMQYNHKLYHEIIREKGLEQFSTHHSWCKETF